MKTPHDFETWLTENEDRLRDAWNERLSYTETSLEHVESMSSDRSFVEYAEEIYAMEIKQNASAPPYP